MAALDATKHAQVVNEERQESNKDIPSMPANAINMGLESKPRDVGHEKKADCDGHEVMTQTNENDAVCSIVYDENYNIHTKGTENLGHG